MYYLLILSIAAASLNSIVLNKAQASGKDEIFKFSFLCTAVWCVVLFAANGFTVRINSQVLLWGIVYGITQTLFILFKTAAMSTGSVAVTTLIGNSSLLISVAVSLIIWREKIGLIDIIGLIMLLLGICLCTYKKTDEGYRPKWKYYAVLFLVFAAGVGITFKAFGKSGNLDYCGDMMFVSSVVMLIAYFSISMLTGGVKVDKPACGNKHKFVCFALLSGVLSCIYNRLNVFLSGSLDAIIFFPSFNGGVIFLSALLSVCMCGEKLAPRQVLGLVLGIIAICVIGIL